MVNVFTDFTGFMIEYLVKDERELRQLKKALSWIPIGINPSTATSEAKDQTALECIPMRARLVRPDGRLFFLDECVYANEEADEITSRMVLPYPVVELNTGIMGSDYHEMNLLKQFFYPAREGRILTPARYRMNEDETNGIIVLWPSRQAMPSDTHKRQLNYLELHMDKGSHL